MKKVIALLVAGLVLLPVSMAAGAGASTKEPAPMFVGGGTFVSNGLFFPGTAVYDGSELQGLPMEVEKGQDIQLTNLDYGDIANCHQLRSYKQTNPKNKKKSPRPLILSKRLCSPGESALVVTSHLKPGRYDAFCSVHPSMYAIVQVNKPN